jgi:hypothetical protein
MEAENAFVRNNGDKDSNNGRIIWTEDSVKSNYVGRGYMALPDDFSWDAKWNKASELYWEVNIYNPGDYYLAVRKISSDNNDNAAFMGADSKQIGGNQFTSIETEFKWSHGSVSLGYLNRGMHTIHIRRKKDGFILDRVMIAQNDNDLPSSGSTEAGPQESSRTDSSITAIEKTIKDGIPHKFILNAAYPNPFNPSTTISYGLPKNVHVKVSVYDIRGRLVTILQDSKQNAGHHRVVWNTQNGNGNSVSSGIYIYRIEAGEFSGVGKLIYLR